MKQKLILKLVLFFLFLIGFSDSSFAQKKFSGKKHKSTTLYEIDGVKVSSVEFNKKLKSLKEIEHTWFCKMMDSGGQTGYDAKDTIANVVYEYKATSVDGDSRNTLRKKVNLK